MRNSLFILITALMVMGCKKPKPTPAPSPTPGPTPGVPAPAKAALTFPSQNEACTEGTIISEAQSSVVFKWNAATNAESYELVLKNLTSGTSTTQSTTATELAVTLSRNTPYSWYVVSKSSKTTSTAQSDTWKFYNAGPGTVSYAPFPAEAVSPTMGQAVTATAGKISLDWNGSDADNDIASYDVYFGTAASPALLQGNVTASILNDVTVVSNTTYYWKVISKDTKGNTSDSGVFQFKVN